MARSTIAVTSIVRSGTTPISATTSDSTNKHSFTNTADVYLEIVSSDAGSQTVTIKANPSYTSDGLVVSDLVITVAAGATKLAGPFKIYTFRQNSAGLTYVDPSVSTTLAIRAWRLPAP